MKSDYVVVPSFLLSTMTLKTAEPILNICITGIYPVDPTSTDGTTHIIFHMDYEIYSKFLKIKNQNIEIYIFLIKRHYERI